MATKEESELVNVMGDQYPQIRNMGEKGMESLIETVSGWAVYIGTTASKEQLVIITQFITQHFSFLTVGEIGYAIQLSVIGKLDCKVDLFNEDFSPKYVGRILQAYIFYRKKNMADLLRRKEKQDLENLERSRIPTPEQQAENMKNIFRELYEQYENKGEIKDVFSMAYNFLKKHRITSGVNTKQDVDDSLAYGKKKYDEDKKRARETFQKFDMPEKTEVEKNARNYLVANCFKKMGIKKILESIVPEKFIAAPATT